MKTILALVLCVVVGFAASKGLLTRAKSRLPIKVLFLTGIEYFLLGILLGPRFLNLLTDQVLDDLKPIVYLALGWAGLANLFYWIDRQNGFGGYWATQILPFGDPTSFIGYMNFETAFYESLRLRKAG